LRALARGCGILGAGGGGDPRIGLLQALQATDECGPVPLVDLDELPDEAVIMPCGRVGAPTVGREKFANGGEGAWLREHIEALTGRQVAALMPFEIGGSNGLTPISWAARTRLPVADADGMGRAFPEVQHVTMQVAGIAPSPCVMADERGNVAVLHAVSGPWAERLARAIAVEAGGVASAAAYVMTVAEARQATVRGSASMAIRIGEALATADADPVTAALSSVGGLRILSGKVTDVDQRTTKGFVRGSVVIDGLGDDAGRTLRLELQNENLVAMEQGEVLASVPDLITVLDAETADAIPTERIRYGQRVTVIAIGCDPVWRTPRGLEVAGPRAFGYDFDYTPVEALVRARA
jgi:DUF917 family protein